MAKPTWCASMIGSRSTGTNNPVGMSHRTRIAMEMPQRRVRPEEASYEERLKSLGLQKVSTRAENQFKSAVAKAESGSETFKQYLKPASQERRLRTSRKYEEPRCRTKRYYDSPVMAAIRHLNCVSPVQSRGL